MPLQAVSTRRLLVSYPARLLVVISIALMIVSISRLKILLVQSISYFMLSVTLRPRLAPSATAGLISPKARHVAVERITDRAERGGALYVLMYRAPLTPTPCVSVLEEMLWSTS